MPSTVLRNVAFALVLALTFAPCAVFAAQPNAPQRIDAPAQQRIAVPPPQGEEAFACRRSSGAFSLPEGAQSVDWVVLNRTSAAQRVRVTVYEWGAGTQMKRVSPGAVSADVAASSSYHNANSVGDGKPFRIGMYYEVLVETATPLVLPSVSVWSTHGNAGIAGTRIGPGEFFALGECRAPQ